MLLVQVPSRYSSPVESCDDWLLLLLFYSCCLFLFLSVKEMLKKICWYGRKIYFQFFFFFSLYIAGLTLLFISILKSTPVLTNPTLYISNVFGIISAFLQYFFGLYRWTISQAVCSSHWLCAGDFLLFLPLAISWLSFPLSRFPALFFRSVLLAPSTGVSSPAVMANSISRVASDPQ